MKSLFIRKHKLIISGMETDKRNFFEYPSKRTLIIFTSICFLGILLLTLVITDLFTESFFKNASAMTYLMMIGAVATVVKLYQNYWKNKDVNQPNMA